jgi:hypothetical protein
MPEIVLDLKRMSISISDVAMRTVGTTTNWLARVRTRSVGVVRSISTCTPKNRLILIGS